MAVKSISMADLQLHAALGTGGGWWSDAGIELAQDYPPASLSSAYISSVGCSTAGGRFNWAASSGGPVEAMADERIRASDEYSQGSNSSTTYQDIEYPGGAYGSMAMAQMLDAYSLQVMDCGVSSPMIFDWSRPFLSTPRADETRVHGVIQEDMYSSRPHCQQESGQIHKIRSTNTVDLLEDLRVMSSNTDWDSLLFPASSVLLEKSSHEQVQSSKPSYIDPPQLHTAKRQLQFTNEANFWNPSMSNATEAGSTQKHHSETAHGLVRNEINIKVNSGAKRCSGSLEENENSEPVLKKSRIETTSPLSSFKVRKEKLGDRITALQQLVSPFGKTDTASVLHEAIDYIKFLHDQVRVLSSPNSKVDGQMQQATKSVRTSHGLRSRGLCLVSISSTVQMVAREAPVDFWPLGFGAPHS